MSKPDPTHVSDEALAELERLEAAATPGPWLLMPVYGAVADAAAILLQANPARLCRHTDAALQLTAAMRNVYPGMAARLRAAEAQRERYHADRDDLVRADKLNSELAAALREERARIAALEAERDQLRAYFAEPAPAMVVNDETEAARLAGWKHGVHGRVRDCESAYARGRADERAAVVAWLREPERGWDMLIERFERGDHVAAVEPKAGE